MYTLRTQDISETGAMISQSQLESYIWGSFTLLRGYIDAGETTIRRLFLAVSGHHSYQIESATKP